MKAWIYILVFMAPLLNASAQTTLINEDFQNPIYNSGTTAPSFTSWTWVDGAYLFARNSGQENFVPADDYPTTTNQVVEINRQGTPPIMRYDMTHQWANTNAFALTLNASPNSWNGTLDRYVVASICETNGTVLWTETTLLPYYDNYGQNPWTPEQEFTFYVLASDFTNGTEGTEVRLEISQAGSRSILIDNVVLTVGDPPTDTDPPAPPPGFSYGPSADDYGIITMTASNAFDPFGVEYCFTNLTLGTSSGWQSGTTWYESGLDQSTTYSYAVATRDLSPSNNMTAFSASSSATTLYVADNVLLIKAFQVPVYSEGANLNGESFPGWIGYNGPDCAVGGNNGLPGDTDFSQQNQGVHFGYTSHYIEADVDHNWSSNDTYTLTLNAAPQATWNYDKQRYIRPSIRQQDGTVLWAPGENMSEPEKTSLPTNIQFQSSTWQAEPDLNFIYVIDAETFSGAGVVEGSPLRVRIASSGVERGVHTDNVMLTLAPPAGTVVIVK